MSTPFASIGGIASGLDTAGIVQQLMQLERRPMQILQQRQATYRAADAAWGSIVSKLSSLRSATDALRDPKALGSTVSVSSSNDAVATASASGGAAQPGTVNLQVQQLARAHQVALGPAFALPDDVVGQGTITFTRGGTDHTVELAEGATAADAARALDRLDGVQARLIDTGNGHQLVVTSTTTGAVSAFELTTDLTILDRGGSPTDVLAQAQDAQLTMGGLTITRASNTIDDLVGGVSLRLNTTGDVTVRIDQDLDTAAKKVTALVDALNGVLTEIAKQSAASAEAGARGPLTGDPLARSMAMELRGSLSRVMATEGPFRTLNDLGINLTRDGKVTLDQTKLRDALTRDPDAAGRLLGRAGTTSDPSVELTATGRAQAGTYQLDVQTAPTIAKMTGAAYSPPAGDPKVFTIIAGGKAVSVTLGEDTDLTTAVQRINDALTEAGVSVVRAKAADDDQLVIEAQRAGAAGSFSLEGEFADQLGVAVAYAGHDVTATLTRDGQTYPLTGSGQTLTAPAGSDIAGLVVRAPLGRVGDLGTVTVENGFAGVLDSFLRTTEGSGGSIARARQAIDGRIRSTQTSVDAFDRRLEQREITIRRQFTALESAMARMSSQASWLASQLGSMQQ